MAVRKKPTGEEWKTFERNWNSVGHTEKVELALTHGVTYDTAKHWISEGDTTPKQLPLPEVATEETEFRELAQDILSSTSPSVHLDFCSFDIETTNLTADFSVMLCACLKPYGQATRIWRADEYPAWRTNRADDSEIVKDVIAEASKHAILITHYGSKFDIPYLRAKMVKYGLPPFPPMFGVDTWSIARPNFKMSSRRLANLARYFEVGSKTGVDGSLWLQAAYAAKEASSEAMDTIVEHCVIDVEVLERVATITFPYMKAMRRL